MTNYLKRLMFVDASEQKSINPFFYPFVLVTLTYGLGFALLGDWTGVNQSSLFQAMSSDASSMPVIWGTIAALASTLAATFVAFRNYGLLGESASMLGFMVWLYASWIYGEGGYWLVLLTVTMPNMYFWGWYYFRVKWWERQKKHGEFIDPS